MTIKGHERDVCASSLILPPSSFHDLPLTPALSPGYEGEGVWSFYFCDVSQIDSISHDRSDRTAALPPSAKTRPPTLSGREG